MAHLAHTATTTTNVDNGLIYRAARAFSVAFARWIEASAQRWQSSTDAAAKVNARRLRLQGAERRREEATRQRFLMPHQF